MPRIATMPTAESARYATGTEASDAEANGPISEVDHAVECWAKTPAKSGDMTPRTNCARRALVSEELTRRFVDLVRRDLHAVKVVISDSEDAPLPTDTLRVALSEGRAVLATFVDAAAADSAMLRRLEILVRAFESTLLGDRERQKRAPVVVSLRDELRAVTTRSGAIGASVIDGHSPVIWASTAERIEGAEEEIPDNVLQFPPEVRETLRLVKESHRGVLIALGVEPEPTHEGDPWEDEPPSEESPDTTAQLESIRRVRALRELEGLHKGQHLSHTERREDGGFLVRSFAGIYCLVLTFDQPFDEIRAERAVRDALPRIERLVLALPPLDPEPVAKGAVARRARRR
jgi:hypothetical protein